MSLIDEAREAINCTIRRDDGQTPEEMNRTLRAEVERLERENAALRLKHNDPREATIESPEGSR